MSVQDVHAPENVVWDTIMDVARYPEMCDGVSSTEIYARRPTPTGGKVVRAKYKLRLTPGVSLQYSCTHIFEPMKHCMTFHLDYSRRSQLTDMAGYWYVEQLPGADKWSRVYFSSDAMIPSWLSWAREGLGRQAAYKNLYWVEAYSEAAMGLSKRRTNGGAIVRKAVVGGAAVAVGARCWRRGRAAASAADGGADKR